MLVLKKYKKTDTTISADYYPEGKEPKGYVFISLPDGEFLEILPSPKHKNSTDPSHT